MGLKERRGKEVKVRRNQHGEQIPEERLKRVDDWILNQVPRRRGHYKGQSVWYIWDDNFNNQAHDELQLITHELLLSWYNEAATKAGYEEENLSTWKKCWYERLQLKGKWKFKTRKENCCPTCVNFIKQLREANRANDESDTMREAITEIEEDYDKHCTHVVAVMNFIQEVQVCLYIID